MHPNNIHHQPYNFEALTRTHPDLADFVFVNQFGTRTINFSDQQAVLHLNKALLKHHYNLTDWNIPQNYLCPPIPGRADYIHHLADLLSQARVDLNNIKGMDIGVGANCIYPLLGARIYNWKMLGVDIDPTAVSAALANVNSCPGLDDDIEIRHQTNHANIFKGVVKEGEFYDFSMCNPPFHSSEKEAVKANLQKHRNLGSSKDLSLNFGGQANELWCNGGEFLFIKRMIKESVSFQDQIGWFTSLVSKRDNLPGIYKLLKRLKAGHKTIEMTHGNKKSRIIAWKFL